MADVDDTVLELALAATPVPPTPAGELDMAVAAFRTARLSKDGVAVPSLSKAALRPAAAASSASLVRADSATALSSTLKAEPMTVTVSHLGMVLRSESKSKATTAAAGGCCRRRRTAAEVEDEKPRPILNDISCEVEPGTLTAILGPSGCGKTSLLNVMAGRLFRRTGGWRLTGTVTYNGRAWKTISRDLVGYVRQDDELLPFLTVEETLGYAAALRLPATLSAAQRAAHVDDVIRELGLKECRRTPVGTADGRPRGCSGGERRRVSIGVQLLTNPSLLFLDEPTTGLDAFTAYNLAQTLRQLSRLGRTVVLSVHQPRADIFELFDRVIFLTAGETIYAGPQPDIAAHLRRLGYVPPPFCNAADYYLDITSIDIRSDEAEAASRERIRGLVQAWASQQAVAGGDAAAPAAIAAASAAAAAAAAADDDDETPTKRTLAGQVGILTGRALRHTWRDRGTLLGLLAEHAILAVVLGLIFFQMPGTLQGIRSRLALLYSTTSLQTYVILLFELQRLALVEIRIFDRERQDRMYTTGAYIISYFLAQLPVWLVLPPIFSTILYWMSGLRSDPIWHYFVFVGVQLLTEVIASIFALFAVSIARDFSQASLIANALTTFLTLVCGFFIQISRVPVWLAWLRWISQFYWAFRLLVTNEFSGNSYDCPEPAGSPECIQYEGSFVISSLAFEVNDYYIPLAGLLGWIVVVTTASYLILRFVVAPPISAGGGPRTRNNNSNSRRPPAGSASTAAAAAAAGLELAPLGGSSADVLAFGSDGAASASGLPAGAAPLELVKIDMDKPAERASPVVELRGVRLEVVASSPLFACAVKPRTVLADVNVTFPPGRVSVILGGSGSGKSSLLNAIARRTQAGYLTRVQRTGDIVVDGRALSANATRKVVSYVMQDDTQLLPFLTVKETLDYAARLRLPKAWSVAAKRARAAEVIRELGLGDCVNVIIGNSLVKGVSGGQRRRVSIGVQILARPSVLLLDEPTSGLDAFTAQNVMHVLHRLSRSGMTVICTIHQPRSDLFVLMEGICILSQGRVAYAGAGAKVVPYFAGLGYPCPEDVNPSDFIVDLTSVDLRSPAAERQSRTRVDELIAAYAAHRAELQPDIGRAAGPGSGEGGDDEYNGGGRRGGAATAASALDLARGSSAAALMPAGPEDARGGGSGDGKRGQGGRRDQQEPRISSLAATALLIRRSYINLYRQPMLVVARLMQVAASGIIFTFFFTPVGIDYIAIQARIGLIQEICALLFVGLLNCVAVFPDERRVFYREHADGLYGPLPFLLSYMMGELPAEIVAAFIFVGVMWGFSGLQVSAEIFFEAVYVCFCYVNVGESVGQIFCVLVEHVGVSVALTSALMSIVTMTAGFMAVDFPTAIQYINYANPLHFGTNILAINDLNGLNLTCTADQQLPSGACIVPNGNAILDEYGMNADDKYKDMWILAVLVVLFRIVVYLLMRLRLFLRRFS